MTGSRVCLTPTRTSSTFTTLKAPTVLRHSNSSCRFDSDRARDLRLESAFRRARKALRLFSPRRQRRYWRLRGWQAQIGADWPATTDVLAILAVAAFETGHNEELRWALEGAADRGVDLSVLQPLAQARLRNAAPPR